MAPPTSGYPGGSGLAAARADVGAGRNSHPSLACQPVSAAAPVIRTIRHNTGLLLNILGLRPSSPDALWPSTPDLVKDSGSGSALATAHGR